eukprot:COSAG01_NODE_30903_length_607_cov_1.692913_1_plen_111_part_01
MTNTARRPRPGPNCIPDRDREPPRRRRLLPVSLASFCSSAACLSTGSRDPASGGLLTRPHFTCTALTEIPSARSLMTISLSEPDGLSELGEREKAEQPDWSAVDYETAVR